MSDRAARLPQSGRRATRLRRLPVSSALGLSLAALILVLPSSGAAAFPSTAQGTPSSSEQAPNALPDDGSGLDPRESPAPETSPSPDPADPPPADEDTPEAPAAEVETPPAAHLPADSGNDSGGDPAAPERAVPAAAPGDRIRGPMLGYAFPSGLSTNVQNRQYFGFDYKTTGTSGVGAPYLEMSTTLSFTKDEIDYTNWQPQVSYGTTAKGERLPDFIFPARGTTGPIVLQHEGVMGGTAGAMRKESCVFSEQNKLVVSNCLRTQGVPPTLFTNSGGFLEDEWGNRISVDVRKAWGPNQSQRGDYRLILIPKTASQSILYNLQLPADQFITIPPVAPHTAQVDTVYNPTRTADLSGTGEPLATIRITVNGKEFTTFVEADGTWAQTIDNLALGENSVPVVQIVAGSVSAPITLPITIVDEQAQITKDAFRGDTPLDFGTLVSAGEQIDYEVTLSNGMSGDVSVAHWDDLSGVLDDAELLDTPTVTTTGNGARPPISLSGPTSTERRITLTGTLAPGATAILRYAVTVRSVAEASGDAVLRNFVLPTSTTTAPSSCSADATDCTEHPVSSWSVEKQSTPDSGEPVRAGDTVTYTIPVTNSGRSALTDIRVEDDLSEVLSAARFLPGSAVWAPAGGASTAVSDPDGTLLAAGPFSLDAGASGELSYRVEVSPDRVGATLTNRITATASTPSTSCSPTGSAAGCVTTHPVESLPSDEIVVQKYSGADRDTPAPLDGARFSLYLDDQGQLGTEIPGALTPVAGSTGRFASLPLTHGRYWLVETQAPSGHELLPAPVPFTVDDRGIALKTPAEHPNMETSGLTLSIYDVPSIALPAAGGSGGQYAALAAGAILLGTTLALALRGRAQAELGSPVLPAKPSSI